MAKNELKKAAIEIIRRKVLTMELEPGAAIDEVQLCSELGISRTPLREVIQRLSGEGFLTLEKNRGAKVASMDISILSDFFQAAPMIYSAISKQAAERATPAAVENLKKIQFAFRSSIETFEPTESALLNHDFHHAIGIMAQTPYLMTSLNRLLIDHARIGQTFYQASSETGLDIIRKAADQHDQLIEAFERFAADEAVSTTLEHWDLSRNNLERFVRPDPLPFELGRAVNEV